MPQKYFHPLEIHSSYVLDMTELPFGLNLTAPSADIQSEKQARLARCLHRGNVLLTSGNIDYAGVCFSEALKIDRECIEALYKLGIIFYRKDDNDSAISALTEAANLAPENPGILNALGAALGRAGQSAKAIEMFKRVFSADPTQAAAAMNCGRLMLSIGDFVHAEAWLAKAGLLRPNHAETLRLLTEARLAIGQPGLALDSGHRAVQLDPSNMSAKLALAQAYLSTRKLEQAHALLSDCLAHNPEDSQALYFLAETEEKRGRTEEARKLYAQVVDMDIDPEFRTLTRLKRVLAVPVINMNRAAIDKDRDQISANLAEIPREPVKDPYRSGGFTNFYLAYQGQADRDIQERVAQFYLECCPGLATVAPHVHQARKREKKRVAILSSFLRSHTVGYLCRGLIERLDRDRFEVVLLRAPVLPIEDPVAPVLAAMADHVVDLPDDLHEARALIAKEEADLLYFPEIGMEDLVYFLAFGRLAPVQVMGWGHPVTSGIPNMDAFLSVAAMEPENGSEHYSETLIELEGLSICVPTPDNLDTSLAKADFGMDESRPAYLCAQSLFKIHPDFDVIIEDLLNKDPNANIYFISMTPQADSIFLDRLRQTVDGDMKRIKILSRVPSKDFPALLKSADVLLDIPHWSGGKTSLESLFAGTPIVHWPGAFMRGRHTLAFYKRMDVMDCVVDNAEAYVETAYRVVHDAQFRSSVRTKIRERAPMLFNDRSAIEEIADVFDRLIDEARRAVPISP